MNSSSPGTGAIKFKRGELFPSLQAARNLTVDIQDHSVLRAISHDGVIRNETNAVAITWGCHRGVMRSLGQALRSLGQDLRSLGLAISWTHIAISWAHVAISWALRSVGQAVRSFGKWTKFVAATIHNFI